MKKVCLNISVLFFCILVSGCIFQNENEKQMDMTPRQYAEKQAEELMQGIINKDKEAIKALFSNQMKQTLRFDKEVEGMLEFIEGEIISYDMPFGKIHGGRTELGKGYVEQRIGGEINNIKTDKGGNYTISFMSYYIYDENKDLVGINIISIFDENSYTEEKPYIPSNIYRIGGE